MKEDVCMSSQQVNRIYQGRVVKVELKNEKEWQESKNWESLLLKHHEVFQSAVNYYLLCFVALAGNKKRPSDNENCPVYRLRKQMKEKWEDFTYKGVVRKGMQKSVGKYLFPDSSSPKFEDYLRKILLDNKSDKLSLHKALTSLLKYCSGPQSIQKQGREFAPAFFWSEYSGQGAFKEGSKASEKNKNFEIFRKKLWNDDISARDLADEVQPEYVLNINNKSYKGEELKKKLEEAIEVLKNEITSKEMKRLENIINKKLKKGLQIPSYRGGGGNVGPRSKAFILFKYVEPNETTRKLLRKQIKKPKELKKSKENQTNNSLLVVNGQDSIEYCRGNRGYVFPAFTAWPQWDSSDLGKPQWKEFDIAAFKEALTVIHQIDEKTKEREQKKEKNQKKLDWMEKGYWLKKNKNGEEQKNTQWHSNKKPDDEIEGGEPPFLGDFKWNEGKKVYEDQGKNKPGDLRIKQLLKILEQDLAQEYFGEDNGVGKIPYGLRRRTVRGFNEIQKKWRSKSKNKEFSKELKKTLKEELNNYQKKNKYMIGSALLFKELLEKENWVIWQEPTEQEQKKDDKKGFAENPLEALCDWYEIREDIEKLNRPIQFTPADPEHSRRLFRFGDVASGFNKSSGVYGHDKNSLSFRTPVIKIENNILKKRDIKIYYSAPRLFRDSLRTESGEKLDKMPWLQPMMKVFNFKEPLEQSFEQCNAQLMPDKTLSGKWRFLVNFPINIEIKKLQSQMGKRSQVDWKKNCKGAGNKYLKWPKNSNWAGDKNMDKVDWFKKTSQFSCLSVDLGQRSAGAFALIRANTTKKEKTRFIGLAEGKSWYASIKNVGLLRLPGEDMKFYQSGTLKTEPYGYKGRKASKEELEETKNTISDLSGKESVKELLGEGEEQSQFSFPELNDKLLVAIRRNQGQLSRYYRWAWMLKENSKKEKVLKEIKEQEEQKEWSKLAKEENSTQKLQILIKGFIPNFQKKLEEKLLLITNRILPLRGRKWQWTKHPGKADCHLLSQTDQGTDTTSKKIHGQRGLSMKRIEQIEELRCRFQSLNQAQRNKIGKKPPSWSEMRQNPIPDPCPDLLKKLEEIKKQRVNQTAHFILAEALGVKLKAPSLSKEIRSKKDIHGEYEKDRDPVNFIVIEDLSRYLAKQDRAPSENSRLMKWSHRAVTNKLKELCEPYGISVLEVPAAYSSRFCSRTGVPGFRAEEITTKDKHRYPYKQWLAQDEKEDKEEKNRRGFLEEFFKILEKNPKKTGFVPKLGGPIFIPIKNYISKNKINGLKASIQQADINAAINIGLRAIASPLIGEIHHRIRSEIKEQSGNKKIIISQTGSIERRRFKTETTEIEMKKVENIKEVKKNSNFFIDIAEIADFEKATIKGIKYATGKSIWTKVKSKQWERCKELNKK